MPHSQLKKPTILVVDDLLLNRRILSCIMRKLGFAVLEANDGLEACDIYDKESCDISAVFLDLNMPQLDGWQTAQRLREMEVGFATARTRLPVIVCTANDLQAKHGLNATVTSSAISAGADEVLNKPMSMSSVELALDRHLPLWRSLVSCFAAAASALPVALTTV